MGGGSHRSRKSRSNSVTWEGDLIADAKRMLDTCANWHRGAMEVPAAGKVACCAMTSLLVSTRHVTDHEVA